MNRLQAIARLRELADKLEAATDAPGDYRMKVQLDVFAWQSEYAARHWIDILGCYERNSNGTSTWYKLPDGVYVFVPNGYYHNAFADLLAGCDVQLVEIGGGE